jgi:putative transposase
MKKTFEYRLYPTRIQRRLLMRCLIDCRILYNEMLERSRDHYILTGKQLFKHDLCSMFKGRGGDHVPQATVQTLADRLEKGFKRFFRHRQLGKKAGFPRFKGPNRWHSIQLRQYGRDVSFDTDTGRLRVPKILEHGPEARAKRAGGRGRRSA